MASTIAGSLSGTTEVDVVPAQVGGGNLPLTVSRLEISNADTVAIYLTVVHTIGNVRHKVADAEHVPAGGMWAYINNVAFTGPSQKITAYLASNATTTNPTFAYTLQ